MKKVIAAIVATILTSSTAIACTQQDDIARLKCYDEKFNFEKVEVVHDINESSLYDILGQQSTEASREIDFKEVENKIGTFFGKVNDIDAPGWLIKDYRVSIQHKDLTAFCYVKPENVDSIASLKKGNSFTCEGVIERYSFMLGSGSVTIQQSIK